MKPRLPRGPAPLTERQLEVARLVADGLTNGEIGQRLGISLDGAKYHVSELLTRLNLDGREEITSWYRASGGRPRRLRVLVGFVGVLAAGAGVFVVMLIGTGSGGSDTPWAVTPEPTIEVTRVVEPTAAPTPLATAVPDVTERRGVAAIYEAMAWDDRRGWQRIPPPSVEVAEAEAAVHRAGYGFGAEPAGFAGVSGGDGCVVFDGAAVRTGDWVVSSVGDSVVRRLRFEAREVAPPEPAHGDGPFLLRLLSLDGEVERSHVYERFLGIPRGTFEWDVVLPAAGRWLAVATAGPNWGCFELSVDQATEFARSAAEAEELGGGYPSMVASAERVAYFDERLAEANAQGGFERRCLDADGLLWAASGEFLGRLDALSAKWSPTRRLSKVGWTPLHHEELEGGLLLTMTLIGAAEHTYSYFERSPVQGVSDGVPNGEFGFITSPTPPRAGQWLIVATAQPGNWGCFLLTLQ